jgi:calcineurin-like phosphoesterase
LTRSLLNYLLNGTIIILLILVGYFGFSLINNSIKSGKDSKDISDTTSSITNQPNLAIQVDVQNGTNESGVAAKFADYLRRNGLDVVEMGNFKGNIEEKTVIIDRSGDLSKAKKVARILGLSDKNVIQQINNSLYLDVTIVIGKDFKELNPYKEIRK